MAEQQSPTSIMHEKPLSPAARAGLVVNAAVTILLFYVTAILWMAGLGALALILLAATALAARFGMAAFVARLLRVPVRLLGILGRKLWLPSEPTYRIALTRSDAPGLFEIARDLSRRSAVAPPQSMSLEMHANAWVLMRGYRRGTGRTTLGIGFDLLAGLTVSEVEAVLAHELAHARLVQRGFSRWLKKGLARLSQVTMELSACAAAYRQGSERSDLTETTVRVFDALTRRAARHVATYSRQDEFAADRGAVELCGAAAIRSALARLEVLDEVVSRLPWSERLARLQPGEAFTAWLVSELTGPTLSDGQASLRHAVDLYSTHPTLRDRLAALPADDAPLRDRRPGVALLAAPDGLAGRLVAEIQRVIAVQEGRDTKRLARDTRRLCRAEGITVVSFLGGIGLIVGLVLGVIGAADGFPLDMMGAAAAALAAGVVLVRHPRHRDRRSLPVPAYGTLLHPRPTETQEQLAAAEEAIVAELRASAARERTRRARLALLVSVSYAALQERDYLRAHVSARLALELKKTSIEAGLAYAIAAAGLGNAQQAHSRLGVIRRSVGFQTLATKWGAAWALSLLDDWDCEGLLQQLHEVRPEIATFASLLALAQLHRHKLQSAIENAARSVALEPANRASVLLLAHVLLLAGRAADAAARLDPLQDYARTDASTAFLMVRLRLMQRDTAGALQWAGVVQGLDPDGASLIALGQAFGAARLTEPAATFFTAAADAHFAPEANIGFAVVASLRGDRAGARRQLLAALKFEGARLTLGQTLGSLFHEILGRLNGLAEQRLDCTAWIATVPAGSLALAGRSILVCAPSESIARACLETIVTAMQGSESAADLSGVTWRVAPKAQQPDRPVPPGVHWVVS
jgi:Zn-dependent protease with chaperone function